MLSTAEQMLRFPQFRDFGQPPWITGILNVTPDSFSDGGLYEGVDAANRRARELIGEGAVIVDIVGESTRPGAKPVHGEEEWKRIGAVVSAAAKEAFVSVDTYRAKTAERSLAAGAKMINDVSALRADPDMAAVLRNSGAYVVLMFSKEDGTHPHATDSVRDFKDVIIEIAEFLEERVDYALKHGISASKIVLDPGMGRFVSHDPKYSWEVLERLHELREKFAEFPLMLGTSRKGFLGGELTERDPLSQLTSIMAYERGADFIRTHNVKLAREFFAVWKAHH